jgi:uncharacterized protein YndB with AHSA1/START domain
VTARRLLLWPAGALAALLLIVVGIGAALPAAHHVTRSATIAAPPPVVFSLVTDVARYPQWRTGVDTVMGAMSGADVARFREVGDDGDILYAVVEAKPYERYVTRIANEDELPFGGSWTFVLKPVEGGTELQITEDGVVKNPVYRFVSRFIMGHDATIERYLADVKRKLG